MSFEHSGTPAGSPSPGSTGGRGNISSSSASGTSKEKQKEKARVSRTSLILWHAHQNDPSAVRKLLEEDQSLVHARDYDSRTPLHVASLHGWIDVAKCLIEHGADVNAQDRWKNTVSFIYLFYMEMIVYRNFFLWLYGSSITILRFVRFTFALFVFSFNSSFLSGMFGVSSQYDNSSMCIELFSLGQWAIRGYQLTSYEQKRTRERSPIQSYVTSCSTFPPPQLFLILYEALGVRKSLSSLDLCARLTRLNLSIKTSRCLQLEGFMIVLL